MVEYNHDDAHRRELSRKLQLLMDVVEADSGQRPPHKEIAAEVEAQGAAMSRPRWGYMLGGNGPAVRDPRLLAALGAASWSSACSPSHSPSRQRHTPRTSSAPAGSSGAHSCSSPVEAEDRAREAGQPVPAAATTSATHHEETP